MEQVPRYSPYELQKARIESGYTLDDAKEALGLKSKSRISEWENGLRYPNLKNLYKLSALYKMPEGQLFYDLRQEAVKDIERWFKKVEKREQKKKKPP
jgi:transcriptional regulator with XRE-family HTH domain